MMNGDGRRTKQQTRPFWKQYGASGTYIHNNNELISAIRDANNLESCLLELEALCSWLEI